MTGQTLLSCRLPRRPIAGAISTGDFLFVRGGAINMITPAASTTSTSSSSTASTSPKKHSTFIFQVKMCWCWFIYSLSKNVGFSFGAHVVLEKATESEHMQESYFVPVGSEREAAKSGGATSSCGEGGGGDEAGEADEAEGAGAGNLAPVLGGGSLMTSGEWGSPLKKNTKYDLNKGLFPHYVAPAAEKGKDPEGLTCERRLVYDTKTEEQENDEVPHRCRGLTMKFRRLPTETVNKYDWGITRGEIVFLVRPGADSGAKADFLYKKTDLGWNAWDTRADIQYKCDAYEWGRNNEYNALAGSATDQGIFWTGIAGCNEERCRTAHPWFAKEDAATQKARNSFFAGSDHDYLRIQWEPGLIWPWPSAVKIWSYTCTPKTIYYPTPTPSWPSPTPSWPSPTPSWPTPAPTPVNTWCSQQLGQNANCVWEPDCCSAGLTCYNSNWQSYALCMPYCSTEWEGWNCQILGTFLSSSSFLELPDVTAPAAGEKNYKNAGEGGSSLLPAPAAPARPSSSSEGGGSAGPEDEEKTTAAAGVELEQQVEQQQQIPHLPEQVSSAAGEMQNAGNNMLLV